MWGIGIAHLESLVLRDTDQRTEAVMIQNRRSLFVRYIPPKLLVVLFVPVPKPVLFCCPKPRGARDMVLDLVLGGGELRIRASCEETKSLEPESFRQKRTKLATNRLTCLLYQNLLHQILTDCSSRNPRTQSCRKTSWIMFGVNSLR